MRLQRLPLLILLAFALSGVPAAAQAPVVADHPRVRQALTLLEVWLDAQRAYDEVPGVSAGVVHDQQLIWSRGFGHADREQKTPATPGTLYSICSISKLFTSIGVMQLRDAGKLRLDDPVAQHLPWFQIRRSDPQAPEITIEGLLTHSAGLPRESDHAYWTGPDFVFPTRQEIVERISAQETLYPAERYYQYSNLGLTLAGEVVAAASGETYEEYVRRHILEPLGLRSTTPDMPADPVGSRLATGYSAITRDGNRVRVPLFTARGIAPAAGFASSVEDLARFASWQFRLLERGGEEVLAANTLRKMHRVHWIDPDFESPRGLGFGVWRDGGKTFVGHGGSCPGYRAQLLLRPEEKVSTVFMANAQGVNATQFAQRMYDIVAPALRAATADSTGPVKQPDPALARYAGSYASGFSGEVAVVPWENGLAMVGLPTMDPMRGLMKLRRTGDHTFRRVRDDGSLAEVIVFEVGRDGRPTQLVWHSNRYRRME